MLFSEWNSIFCCYSLIIVLDILIKKLFYYIKQLTQVGDGVGYLHSFGSGGAFEIEPAGVDSRIDAALYIRGQRVTDNDDTIGAFTSDNIKCGIKKLL